MRAFIAVNLPASTRRTIMSALEPARSMTGGVRWLKADALHVTLIFLGDVDDARPIQVERVMTDVAQNHSPFTLTLRGTGVFPDRKRPSVWWVGCTADALTPIHAELQDGLRGIGFDPERRAYRPHVTVGRTKLDRAPRERGERDRRIRADTTAFERTAIHEQVQVRTLDLMRSHLSSAGARYECVRSVPLQGAS